MEVVIFTKECPKRVLKLGTFDVGTEEPSESLSKLPCSGSKFPMSSGYHGNDIGTQKLLFT